LGRPNIDFMGRILAALVALSRTNLFSDGNTTI
jgi:hypothetical protein